MGSNDFLPSPNQLVEIDDKIKVTIALTRDTVEFFKSIADKNNSNYQKMIRILLDAYVAHFKDSV